MKKSSKISILTLTSASVLLGLGLVSNQAKTVYADTIDQNQINSNDQTNNSAISNNTDDDQTTDQIDPDTGLSLKTTEILNETDIDYSTLSKVQTNALKYINYHSTGAKTGTQFTYDQYRSVANKMINRDVRYRVPYFNAKKIKNMKATTTRDAQTGKKAKLDIWDSWLVQDEETGRVVNYHGYQLAVAMMGIPNKNDSHIYLLYNKYGDNKLEDWQTVGPIFGFGASPLHQEWSGSATLNKDGSIQLFYTDVDTTNGDNHQIISTANLELAIDSDGKLHIARVNDRHELFEGDGYHYQTYTQWKATNKGADNIAMRDAHVIALNGHRYLIFEASTGNENYQGSDQIYNWQNYGGSDSDAMKNLLAIVKNSDMRSRASWANAALGILRLTDNENNPEVEDVYTPLVSAPMVTDEIERPDVLKLNGKYYLFATTRLNHGTGDDLWKEANVKVGDNVAMLGWVSDDLLSGYKPLNGDATVLTGSVPFNWRTATYSYYAVPVPGREDEVLITSYMSNRGYAAGKRKLSTWAPSFLVRINPDDTTEVLNVGTNQGDWIYDEDSENPDMIVASREDARLKGEPEPRKDGKLKKRYSKKHKKSRKHNKKRHSNRKRRNRR